MISSSESENRIPDFGPLKITDAKKFFEDSKTKFEETWLKPFPREVKLDAFMLLKRLGKGSFGQVILVEKKSTGKFYAMKAMEKKKLVRYKQIEHLRNEKNILQNIDFPFTIYLVYFLIDNSYVYIVMPFMPGGELYFHLKKRKTFSEKDAKFYVGQAILALEYLHYLNFVYRDLKPENIVLDHTGYAKLTDFGFCKRLKDDQRTYTLCGTPNYLAPEVLLNKGHGKPVDWWGIGVLMFELVSGNAPFDSPNAIDIYENIIVNKYDIPNDFTPELQNLVENTLQSDLTRRFGNLKNGVDDIKNHKWFKNFDWLALLNRMLVAPFLPKYDHPDDCSNFDETGTSEFKGLKIASKELYPEEFSDFSVKI